MVEDEPTILELLSGSLRFAGFDVVTAATGAEALRATARVRPDLILLDVMMPDGDGFDVLRQIRCGGPHVPVTFLTARGTVHDRVAGLTLGGDDSDQASASTRCWPGCGRCAPQPEGKTAGWQWPTWSAGCCF